MQDQEDPQDPQEQPPLAAAHRVRVLGAFVLERQAPDGGWEVVLRGGKGLALLVHLSAQEGAAVSRERVADLLWGDEAPERARGSLRQALHLLRRLLGEGIIVTDRETVALPARAVTVDRDQFLQAAREGAFTRMLDLYGGEFCANLSIGGAATFERWVTLERARLRESLLKEAWREITRLITAGAGADALTAARRVARAEPHDPRSVALLFDALVAAGALAEARERIEAAQLRYDADGRELPKEIADRAERVRRSTPIESRAVSGTLDALGQMLVGRDELLAALQQEAERAKRGGPRRVVLVGPTGAGKTRVLDEFESRMRLRGARVVRVRFLPGMREVPFAALADVVRGLCGLPGALGVAERTARELVALLPELVSRYPGARDSVLDGSDRMLARRDAFADLLASVAEGRLVVLLLDDLQYGDESSLRVITGAARAPALRLLEVIATRPGNDLAPLGADAEFAVEGISEAEIRALLDDVTVLPAAAWSGDLVRAVWARSRGVPQVVLQVVRGLDAARLLTPGDATWETPDPQRLLAAVETVPVTEGLLASMPVFDMRILQLLGAWARPLDERGLSQLVALDTGVTDATIVRAALRRLEAAGVVAPRDTSWAIAHDSIAEEIARVAEASSVEAPLDTLIRYWSRAPQLTVGVVEHLALLCGTTNARARARRLIRGVAGTAAVKEAGLRGRRLARMVARAAGRPEWEDGLYREIGFLKRQTEAGLAALGVLATLVIGASVWFAWLLQPRLMLEAEPLVDHSVVLGVHELAVQPRIAVVDGLGRRRSIAGEVRVRYPSGIVRGDTVVALDSGRAQFTSLVLESATRTKEFESVSLTFEGPWYVRPVATRVRGTGFSDGDALMRPIRVVANGVPLDSTRVFTTARPDTIRFDLTFEYTTRLATANYVVGAGYTWGEPAEAVIRLAGLPSPVQRGWRTVTFSVPPPPVGSHHVVILAGAEDRAANIFSATNWAVGRPEWGDGNDVVRLPYARLEALRTSGAIELELLNGMFSGQRSEVRVGDRVLGFRPVLLRERVPMRYRGTAIRVDVTGR